LEHHFNFDSFGILRGSDASPAVEPSPIHNLVLSRAMGKGAFGFVDPQIGTVLVGVGAAVFMVLVLTCACCCLRAPRRAYSTLDLFSYVIPSSKPLKRADGDSDVAGGIVATAAVLLGLVASEASFWEDSRPWAAAPHAFLTPTVRSIQERLVHVPPPATAGKWHDPVAFDSEPAELLRAVLAHQPYRPPPLSLEASVRGYAPWGASCVVPIPAGWLPSAPPLVRPVSLVTASMLRSVSSEDTETPRFAHRKVDSAMADDELFHSILRRLQAQAMPPHSLRKVTFLNVSPLSRMAVWEACLASRGYVWAWAAAKTVGAVQATAHGRDLATRPLPADYAKDTVRVDAERCQHSIKGPRLARLLHRWCHCALEAGMVYWQGLASVGAVVLGVALEASKSTSTSHPAQALPSSPGGGDSCSIESVTTGLDEAETDAEPDNEADWRALRMLLGITAMLMRPVLRPNPWARIGEERRLSRALFMVGMWRPELAALLSDLGADPELFGVPIIGSLACDVLPELQARISLDTHLVVGASLSPAILAASMMLREPQLKAVAAISGSAGHVAMTNVLSGIGKFEAPMTLQEVLPLAVRIVAHSPLAALMDDQCIPLAPPQTVPHLWSDTPDSESAALPSEHGSSTRRWTNTSRPPKIEAVPEAAAATSNAYQTSALAPCIPMDMFLVDGVEILPRESTTLDPIPQTRPHRSYTDWTQAERHRSSVKDIAEILSLDQVASSPTRPTLSIRKPANPAPSSHDPRTPSANTLMRVRRIMTAVIGEAEIGTPPASRRPAKRGKRRPQRRDTDTEEREGYSQGSGSPSVDDGAVIPPQAVSRVAPLSTIDEGSMDELPPASPVVRRTPPRGLPDPRLAQLQTLSNTLVRAPRVSLRLPLYPPLVAALGSPCGTDEAVLTAMGTLPLWRGWGCVASGLAAQMEVVQTTSLLVAMDWAASLNLPLVVVTPSTTSAVLASMQAPAELPCAPTLSPTSSSLLGVVGSVLAHKARGADQSLSPSSLLLAETAVASAGVPIVRESLNRALTSVRASVAFAYRWAVRRVMSSTSLSHLAAAFPSLRPALFPQALDLTALTADSLAVVSIPLASIVGAIEAQSRPPLPRTPAAPLVVIGWSAIPSFAGLTTPKVRTPHDDEDTEHNRRFSVWRRSGDVLDIGGLVDPSASLWAGVPVTLRPLKGTRPQVSSPNACCSCRRQKDDLVASSRDTVVRTAIGARARVAVGRPGQDSSQKLPCTIAATALTTTTGAGAWRWGSSLLSERRGRANKLCWHWLGLKAPVPAEATVLISKARAHIQSLWGARSAGGSNPMSSSFDQDQGPPIRDVGPAVKAPHPSASVIETLALTQPGPISSTVLELNRTHSGEEIAVLADAFERFLFSSRRITAAPAAVAAVAEFAASLRPKAPTASLSQQGSKRLVAASRSAAVNIPTCHRSMWAEPSEVELASSVATDVSNPAVSELLDSARLAPGVGGTLQLLHQSLLGALSPEVASLIPTNPKSAMELFEFPPSSRAHPPPPAVEGHSQVSSKSSFAGTPHAPKAVVAILGESLSEVLTTRDLLYRAGVPLVVALRPCEPMWLHAEAKAIRAVASPPRSVRKKRVGQSTRVQVNEWST
jgi:hypothetical protein